MREIARIPMTPFIQVYRSNQGLWLSNQTTIHWISSWVVLKLLWVIQRKKSSLKAGQTSSWRTNTLLTWSCILTTTFLFSHEKNNSSNSTYQYTSGKPNLGCTMRRIHQINIGWIQQSSNLQKKHESLIKMEKRWRRTATISFERRVIWSHNTRCWVLVARLFQVDNRPLDHTTLHIELSTHHLHLSKSNISQSAIGKNITTSILLLTSITELGFVSLDSLWEGKIDLNFCLKLDGETTSKVGVLGESLVRKVSICSSNKTSGWIVLMNATEKRVMFSRWNQQIPMLFLDSHMMNHSSHLEWIPNLWRDFRIWELTRVNSSWVCIKTWTDATDLASDKLQICSSIECKSICQGRKTNCTKKR